MPEKISPFKRLLDLFREEREGVRAIYFYAILNGVVGLIVPLGTQAIISFVMGGVVSVSLVLLIVLVVIATFVVGLLQVNQKKIIEKIEQKIFVRYGFLYAERIPKIALRDAHGKYLPELSNRFFDSITLQKSFAKLLLSIPEATIQILFGLILLSFYSPVFIVFGFSLLFVLVLILRLTGKKGIETSVQESNHKYEVAGFLQEIARSPAEFKFGGKSGLHLRRTDMSIGSYLNRRTAHFKILLTQYWTLIIFKVLITLSMLVVGSALLLSQKLNIGQFVAIELVIITVIYSVEKLISSLEVVYDMATAAEKVAKLPEKSLEHEGSFLPTAETAGMGVQMQGLSFAYPHEPELFRSFSATLQPGEKVVLTGDDEDGKAALLRVVSGLLQPGGGALLYNDISYGEYDLNALRARIGAVLEESSLFEGTLAENLTFGRDLNPTKIREIAKRFHLEDFIFSHPEGLQQPIPMAGYGLSPRLQKKIALLRALLGEPALLIIESPGYFLDEEELKALRSYLEGKASTCIINSQHPVFVGSGMRTLNLSHNAV